MVESKVREGRTFGKIIGIMLAILLLAGATDAQAFISVSISLPDLYLQPTHSVPVVPLTTVPPTIVSTIVSTIVPTPSGAGSISGMKFNDSNGNGVRDAGEEGLSGWTITLTNSNGSMENTTTNSDGFYMFNNLPAGNYKVSEVLQPGWVQTFPVKIYGKTYYNITLSKGEDRNVSNFGNMRIPQSTSNILTFNISGFKINNATGNGIPGWNITLSNDTMQTSTLTDIDGSYHFTGLLNGTYSVTEETRSDFTPNGPTSQKVTISGADVMNINFTNTPVSLTPTPIPSGAGSISGVKFNDSNGNGVRDAGEEGLSGWTITLTNSNGSMENTTTNSDGFYMFNNLPAGNYKVSEVLQPGWVQTFPLALVHSISISAGEHVADVDFGNMQIVPPTTIPPTAVPVPTSTPIPTSSSTPYIISVSTSPSDLNPQPTGGGTYSEGQTVTVTAQPVTGYSFQGWTENGIQVSINKSYSFTATENQTFMADYISVPTLNISTPYTISVSTSPSGLNPQPTGGGTHYYGDTVTLTSQPIAGYKFQKWTENGKTVSINASYRFTAFGDRNLRAEYSEGGKASIIIEPSSGTPGSEITVKGTGFKISAQESQKVLIYLDDRVVKEGAIERDTSGSLGSFRTTFIVPFDIRSGYYKIMAKGLIDSALADFEVKNSVPYNSWVGSIWVYIAGISSIIVAIVAFLNYQEARIKKSKQLPIKIETGGGVESTYYDERAINMDVKGGVERS